MARTFHIFYDAGKCQSSDEHFLLWLPSGEVPSDELERSILGRLGLPESTRLFFTRGIEHRNSSSALVSVPLTAALPDGMRLRAHLVEFEQLHAVEKLASVSDSLSWTSDDDDSDTDGSSEEALMHPRRRRRRRSCKEFLYERWTPSVDKVGQDLANERTLLAWLRTSMSSMSIVFTWLTLQAFAPGWEVINHWITVTFATLMVFGLIIGWTRYREVRALIFYGSHRRVSLRPILVMLAVIFTFTTVGIASWLIHHLTTRPQTVQLTNLRFPATAGLVSGLAHDNKVDKRTDDAL